jgi:hypothetical protein
MKNHEMKILFKPILPVRPYMIIEFFLGVFLICIFFDYILSLEIPPYLQNKGGAFYFAIPFLGLVLIISSLRDLKISVVGFNLTKEVLYIKNESLLKSKEVLIKTANLNYKPEFGIRFHSQKANSAPA